MLIKINGKAMEISDSTSILNLVIAGNLPEKAIIIELNGTIITRKGWECTTLKPDDSLEIIRIIGGG